MASSPGAGLPKRSPPASPRAQTMISVRRKLDFSCVERPVTDDVDKPWPMRSIGGDSSKLNFEVEERRTVLVVFPRPP